MNRPACLKQFSLGSVFFQNGWSVAVLLGGILKHQLLQAKFRNLNGVLNLFVSWWFLFTAIANIQFFQPCWRSANGKLVIWGPVVRNSGGTPQKQSLSFSGIQESKPPTQTTNLLLAEKRRLEVDMVDFFCEAKQIPFLHFFFPEVNIFVGLRGARCKKTHENTSLRIQVCPERLHLKSYSGGLDWNPQSYSREGSGFLGNMKSWQIFGIVPYTPTAPSN